MSSPRKKTKGSSLKSCATPTRTIPAKKDFKIRFSEDSSVAEINAVLDSIDACKGYCPCQKKSAGTKCHCLDFRKNKAIGEPCICGIYVKQPK